MWNLIKSMFRYSFKNKGSFFGLFFLVYIAIATFSCFGTLNNNLLKAYNGLITDYNMHNVIVNELYDSNNRSVSEARFRTWLSSQSDFEYRTFDSFDVTTNSDSYKMVKYSSDYKIDMLDMFENNDANKWIIDSIFHPLTINDVVYQAQISQSKLNNVIKNMTMSEFVKQDIINKDQNWYSTNNSFQLPPNSKLWFGCYQNKNLDLVIDAYVINSHNEVEGYRSNFLTLNKKDFLSYSNLTLDDFSNNFSWKYTPNSIYNTPSQAYLDKIDIILEKNNGFGSQNNNNLSIEALNTIQYNKESDVKAYLKNDIVGSIIVDKDKIIDKNTNPTSNDIIDFLLANYNSIQNIRVFPAKDNYYLKSNVSEFVDFIFQNKSGVKINTYIIKNVPKDKYLYNRQVLFSFAANSTWSSTNAKKIKQQFRKGELFVKNNPIFDYGWLVNETAINNNPSDTLRALILKSNLGIGLKEFSVNTSNNSYLMNGIKNWVVNKHQNANGINLLISGFKVVFDLSSEIEAVSGVFIDPTSFAAVVSPTWLEKNHKEILPKSEWNKFINKVTGETSLESCLQDIPEKYKINISSTPYLILSTGITPDFMYPIISFANMVPDPLHQAIVYVGETGYLRCFEAFQNNPCEHVLLGKYAKSSNLNSFINSLNEEIAKNNMMAWPKGINAVFSYDSTENKITPATLRVTFTSSLIKTVNGFSISISVFISLIAIFIITILIRQFVIKNRQTLGIMNANGLSKSKIIYALSTLSLIPSALGGLLGFLVGFFTNKFALGLFDTYWLIPITNASFNILFFFLSILIPLILFITITLLIGLFSLRGSATELLAKNQTIKVGIIAKTINRGISKTPIMMRFRTSIIFSTFYRLIVLSLMTSLVVFSTEFMASSMNSFNVTNNTSSKETDYKFGIELFTPTIEGGQYYGLDYDNLGKPFLLPYGSQGLANGTYKDDYKNDYLLREYANLHFPSVQDSNEQSNKLDYLKLKTQVREMINFNMLSSNPWEFAQSMMPSNQANQAINCTKNINEMLMSDTRLQPLGIYINKTIDNYTSLNFPEGLTPTTLENLVDIGKNGYHLNSPGLLLTKNNSNNQEIIKPMHIINFNGEQKLNYNQTDELCIDVNDLGLSINDNIVDINYFLTLDKKLIIEKINSFYTSHINNNNLFGINGIFKNDSIQHIKLKVSNSDENVIDIVFDETVDPNLILQTKSVLTNRNLFTGYYYEAHQPSDDKYNSSTEAWKQDLIQNANNWFIDPFCDIDNQDEVIYYSAINTTMSKLIKLKTTYINFVLNYFNDPIYSPIIFRLTYGLIGINDNKTSTRDEPYVYVNSKIRSYNGKETLDQPLTKYLADNNIQLIGIVDNSQYIKLFDNKHQLMNKALETWDVHSNEIPLIINEFAAKTFGLKINDKITIVPSNTVDRYGFNLTLGQYHSKIVEKAQKYNLKIVGISQSFHNSYAYIPINAARILIGMEPTTTYYVNGENLSPFITNFNGIFSKNPSPYSISNTVALYSPNGLYPGVSSWEPVGDLTTKLLTNAIKSGPESNNYKMLNIALGSTYFDNNSKDRIAYLQKSNGLNPDQVSSSLIQQIAKILSENYGATSYQSLVMNVIDVDNSNVLYSSLSDTMISLEATVLTLIFVIALIVMMIMLWMILMDLMPLLALLSTMGLSIWSNSLTFMCILIPTWFLTGIISGPIVYAFLNLFVELIFKGIGILLMATFNWWAYLLIMLVLAGIFGIVYILGAKKLLKVNIVDAIKR